jgi:formate/nitrite transporter FocA (FNT family)
VSDRQDEPLEVQLTHPPEPEEIYRRTREEGERRLQRPIAEIVSTALAAGFDIAAGVTVLGIVSHLIGEHFGREVGHFAGSLGFGIAFVFLVVGRGELFTENFLVPLAGLDHRDSTSWWALIRLWLISPIFNVLGGLVIVLLLTVHGVLPTGTGTSLVEVSSTLHRNHVLALFVSALFAGALMTAMTWFVEGQAAMMVRIVIAWIAGSILALGGFNHVIVDTLELVYGLRFGDDIPWTFIVGNFGIAAVGNLLGGIGLVTLNRFTQAHAGSDAN